MGSEHLGVEDEHLAELFRLLYPEPYTLDLPGRPAAPRAEPVRAEFLLLPDARRPRLALPAEPRAVRVAAVRHLPRPRDVAEQLRNAGVRAVLGVSGAALRDRVRVHGPAGGECLAGHLSRLLGEPVCLCVHVGGPLRANRKPVVELLRRDGTSLGFAKLGSNELTRKLVRAEAHALATLGSTTLRTLTVPRLRYIGCWQGQEILVQQALPVWRPAAVRPGAAVGRAMVELAAACGSRRQSFGASGYRQQLSERLDAVAARPGVGPALRTLARDCSAKAEELRLTFGAWHGDWTPWNTRATDAGVLVWDWERFTTGVPVGFDALHWQLHTAVDAGTPARQAAAALPERAAALLAPFGVGPAAARFTAVLYLLDLGARYLADRLDQGSQRLSALGEWLLPVLVAESDRALWVERAAWVEGD